MSALDPVPAPNSAGCPESKRKDGDHSWHFDGDDPRVICVFCGEIRDALTGDRLR